MNSEELLSICIPTFNRADLLKTNVLELIEEIRIYNIPIIISDNNSTDETEKTVDWLKGKYKYITYYKQEKNIQDRNFIFVLEKATTKYAWLLGDKNRIIPGAIKNILNSIRDKSFDAIIVNCSPARVKSIPSRVYTQPVELLNDLGWHTTMISTLIFSSELTEKKYFERYTQTKFMHVAGLFDALSERKCSVLWIDEPVITGPKAYVPNDWINNVFEIFFESWANSVMSLPPTYPVHVKLQCVKHHGTKAKVFIFERFIYYRSRKIYNFAVFKKYQHNFRLFTNVPKIILLSITFFPPWFFSLMYYFLRMYKEIDHKD